MSASTLQLGKPVVRQLRGRAVHVYHLRLRRGEFARITVDQRGAGGRGTDVLAAAFTPRGRKVADYDIAAVARVKIIELKAGAPGDYRVEVRALDPRAPAGRYGIELEQLLGPAQYAAALAADRAKRDDVTRWLQANAIRLRTAEAGHGFGDMQPLKQVIGDARVVALGEATHGTREFFQLKHRMLELLVEEMGFTAFGIEANLPEAFAVNDYVLTGKGDPRQALAGLYFQVWQTEEVLDLIEWMRRHNANPRHRRKVKFCGFDMQVPSRAAEMVRAYLREAGAPRTARTVLDALADPEAPTVYALAKERQRAFAAAARRLLAQLDRQREAYCARTSAKQWSRARQLARLLVQCLENVLDPAVRDPAMAENVKWLLEREGPGARIMLWAHNWHVSAEHETAMGYHLRRLFGPTVLLLGFAFNRGRFRAADPSHPSRAMRSFRVAPAPEESLDATLAEAGLRLAAVDLRALPAKGPVADWFRAPRLTRGVDAVYDGDAPAGHFAYRVLPSTFDVLLFVEETSAARPFA